MNDKKLINNLIYQATLQYEDLDKDNVKIESLILHKAAVRISSMLEELEELREFRSAAFISHPNIDLDIEGAI